MCMELAEAAYEAYGESLGWKSYYEDALPEWHNLPEEIQSAWAAASAACVEHAKETQTN